MTLTFKLHKPNELSSQQKTDFLALLIRQGQVANPTVEKVNLCVLLCIVYADNNPIAIGAIKQVYKSPFDYAGLSSLKNSFDYELGYLFVEEGPKNSLRGLSIGKTISKLLINQLGYVNVFATTEITEDNSMKYILEKIGFKKEGQTYIGRKTGKEIALYLKYKN